jgi:hypothetical protein
MSLIGSVIGGVMGLKADRAKNKRAKEELALQKQLAGQQIDLSKYIQGLSQQLMSQGSGMVDPYGGSTTYDPVSKRWISTMGVVPASLQAAADTEEAQRLTVDQAMRRRALQDLETRRSAASGEAGTSLDAMARFRQGIGAVDPAAISSQIRLDRQGAINAGYDDAERAATKLQLRTGSSAVGDALGSLARDRVRAQASIGSPEIEGLQLAEGINQGRSQNLAGLYNMFSGQADKMYDAPFSPAPYAELAASRGQDAQKLDLSRYEVGMGGSGTAAAGIGSAAAGIRQGYQLSEANRIHAPGAKFVGALDKSLDEAVKRFMMGG